MDDIVKGRSLDAESRRALQLDTLSAILPMDRRDRLAQLLMESGSLDEAQQLLEVTIQNAPGYAPAYFTLSQIYDRRGMGDLAERFLEQYERMTASPPVPPESSP